MVNITFLNDVGTLSTQANKVTTSVASNSIFLYFDTDEQARSIEDMLKRKGYITEHTDKTVKIFNANDFDLIFD